MTDVPRKLYQRVAQALSAHITSGKYAIGSRLPGERDLATEFEVSRPTVREALIALEIRGLVEAREKSGVYVVNTPDRHPGIDDLDVGAFELVEARIVVEGEAAALAALAIDQPALDQLNRLLDKMAAHSEQPSKVDVDREFHLAIATATGNSLIYSMVKTLWDVRETSPMCRHIFAEARRTGVAPRVDEHQAIVDALASRDSQAARAAMRAHLSRVTEDLLEATRLELMQRAQEDFDAQRSQVTMRAGA